MKVPAPGEMIDIQGRQLHLLIQGRGGPAVILEAGIAATSLSWALVQPRIAEFTTVISYDRAGLGWSDPSVSGGSIERTIQDLILLAEGCGPAGPFVFVGHSFGGLIVRILAQRRPDLVAGLVLLDPVVRSEWRSPSDERRKMLRRGVRLSRRGAWLARVGVVGTALRMLLGGSSRLPKMMARFSAGRGAGVADRLAGEIRKLPPELWPAIAAHWSASASFLTMANNLEQLPESVGRLDENAGVRDIPLIVLSGAKGSPEHAADARLSTRGEHIVLPASGHWVQLDAPGAVIDAVRRVCALIGS